MHVRNERPITTERRVLFDLIQAEGEEALPSPVAFKAWAPLRVPIFARVTYILKGKAQDGIATVDAKSGDWSKDYDAQVTGEIQILTAALSKISESAMSGKMEIGR